MLILLDSNIFISAMLSPQGIPARIVGFWRGGKFQILTCQQQIDEIRLACRNPRFRDRLQPHGVGTLLNHLYGAVFWPRPVPRRHQADDPTDSFLLDLMEAAQPDYAITGDKRAGLLGRGTLGRTKIITAAYFVNHVLRA